MAVIYNPRYDQIEQETDNISKQKQGRLERTVSGAIGGAIFGSVSGLLLYWYWVKPLCITEESPKISRRIFLIHTGASIAGTACISAAEAIKGYTQPIEE